MKSFKIHWFVGIRFLALCLFMLSVLIFSVISVQAADDNSKQIYEFSPHAYKLDDKIWVFEGGDIDFVSGFFAYVNPNDGQFSINYVVYGISYEPFVRYVKGSNMRVNSENKLINGKRVYYVGFSYNSSGYSEDYLNYISDFSGLPNLKEVKTDFNNPGEAVSYSSNDFVQRYLEEFVTNGGIDWEDFLHPDEDNVSGIGGGNIQDLEAFVSDDVLYCSWTGLSGSIPGASTKSFISPTLIFADRDNPEDSDLIRQLKYSENFWVSDYSLEVDLKSLFKENEFLYGIRLTPYYYTDDNDIKSLMKGISTTIYFDKNGQWDENKNGPSHGGGSHNTNRDFSLSGIYVETTPFSQQIIHWSGTTIDDELSFVPDKNTKVVAYVEWIDVDGNYIYEEYKTSTIGKGWLSVYITPIQTESKNSELSWTGRVRLEPAYKIDNVTYLGKYSYVDFENELITGGDLGDASSSDFDSLLPKDDPITSHFSISDVTNYAELGLGFLSGLLDLMGSFPKLIAAIFSFMPEIYIEAIGAFLLIIFIARILGR